MYRDYGFCGLDVLFTLQSQRQPRVGHNEQFALGFEVIEGLGKLEAFLGDIGRIGIGDIGATDTGDIGATTGIGDITTRVIVSRNLRHIG